ncbi:hypothetical protein ABZ568_00495 [Streptomyces olindensis]|uniref:Uncharacterized protein n=1 Tax=Streptomyces olindensis TaxID=358823 RepID=A0ABV2XLR9_9ACTN
MGCGCGGSRARARSGTPATLYKVMVGERTERVAFQTTNPVTAKNVARNYPGSRIYPDPDADTNAAQEPVEDSASSTETAEAAKTL